ncbi:hypothetical protein, partial [Streptomyces sp. NPDC003857]
MRKRWISWAASGPFLAAWAAATLLVWLTSRLTDEAPLNVPPTLPRTGDGPRTLRAVDDVSLTLHRGQTLALV